MDNITSYALTKKMVSEKYVSLENLAAFKENLLESLSKQPLYQHKCNNCGANLLLDENKPIFICKFCGSTYAVGTNRMNDGR